MGQVNSNSLITASKQNLIDEVRALLSFGIDVERMNEQHNNALHVACFAGHHLVVQALLQHKANPNLRNGEGDTPLILAVTSGNLTCCKFLTAAKASVVMQDADGFTAVHFAAGFGYLNILSHFIDCNPSSCDIKSKSGVSPALCSILNGHVECLIYLLRRDKNIVTSRVGDRNTLLHIAAQEGNSAMCQALLSCGAVVSMQNNNGDSPIDIVLTVFKDASLPAEKRHGLRECFLLLMKYREIQELEEEKQVSSKSTPSGFLLAACKSNIAELQRYIQEGFPVDFCDTPDHHGFTALHAACLSGQLEAAKILIANGAQINKTTSSGDYPFMLALISGSPSLAHHLLEMGANGDVVDKFGNSPMHIAMADGNRNIAMILIQKKFALHTQNRQGLTPLLCAVINGHSSVVKLLCNHDISVLGACTLRGEFPLHLATLLPTATRKQMVTALLECKAVPTLVNSSGLTALEIALGNNSDSEILDALRLAEARDMENVANGVKNKALRKLPRLMSHSNATSATGSPIMNAALASPTRRFSMDRGRRGSVSSNPLAALRKLSVQGKLASVGEATSPSEHFALGPAAIASAPNSLSLPAASPTTTSASTDHMHTLDTPQRSSPEVAVAVMGLSRPVTAPSPSATQSFESGRVMRETALISAHIDEASVSEVSELHASYSLPSSSTMSALGDAPQAVLANVISISPVASSLMQRSNPSTEPPAVQAAAPPAPVCRRRRNPLHIAVATASAADVQQLLASNPEYLDDVDFDGHTPVALSLQLANSAISSMLRTVGLCHMRHAEAAHNDSLRRDALDCNMQVCKLIGDKVGVRKEEALVMEYTNRHRRSVASSCFNEISSILSKNMNSFQESQWRLEQRTLALRLASAFKSQRFRQDCSKRASDRHRSLAQSIIACAFRVHCARLALLSKRDDSNLRAGICIYFQFFRHCIRRRTRARAALVIQNAWHLRGPFRAIRNLKRFVHQNQALLVARRVLAFLFKFFAARLAFAKARVQYLHRRKMIAIALENELTGSFAIRLQNGVRCMRARKAYTLAVKQRNCTKIQCFYRAHLARCHAASAAADESSLATFKSGYCFSMFGGISGFVPKVRMNLGGLVTRCALKLQRSWRGRSARLLIARLAIDRAHASARTLQFQYARHYHFDWYINNIDANFSKLKHRVATLLQTQFRRFSARRKLKAAWRAYYIGAFYPGAAVKIQAFARRIFSRSAIAAAELYKLQCSQSVVAQRIQRVIRGHFHRQFILQLHAGALTLQRAFRGHRSRYLSLGKERNQMETWVNLWMQLVVAGVEGEAASRDVEMQLNHVLVKPEPSGYFLGGDNGILYDTSFSQLYHLVEKQSVRSLHHKIVSLADACMAPSSSIPTARVEGLTSFIIRCAAIISGQHLADNDSVSIGVQLLTQVQQLLDAPLMRSPHRPLLKAWTAFTMANCFVQAERFETAHSVLLQYSKSTDSNTVDDCCTVSILLCMSFLRNKLGFYRDAIASAYEAISILRLFPGQTTFNAFFWWGTDRLPHDAIDLKRQLTLHDLAIIAELNLCSGLCMLGRWSHGHASIKRCTWIKRSDGVSLQHLKRVLSKYILILQRTITILKLSPLVDTSVLGTSVWPLISGSTSPWPSSPNMRPSPNSSFSNFAELKLGSPFLKPASSASVSPHLAGKLRPGSAGMLRPVSAMSATSQASNITLSDSNLSVVTSSSISRPASAISSKPHAVRMMSPDAVARLRYIDGESLSPYKISPLNLHVERMFDPIVSRSSVPIIAPGSSVSAFVSAFHDAGGLVILGQTSKWNKPNEGSMSDGALGMGHSQEKGANIEALAPIWIPFFPISDRQLLFWETPELTELKDLWSSRQHSKFWSAFSRISREIDDVQTAIGKVNDMLNKHFTIRVQSLCSLCLQLAFINISSFEYSLSLRFVDTAQRLSIGTPLPPRLFAWMITIKARALSALSRSKDAVAELSALTRHKRLEADPFLRSCVFQLLSAALTCDGHFAAALQAAKDAHQHAGLVTSAATCVQLYKKLTSSIRPTLHDIDAAALHAFATHNAAIAAHLSDSAQAAEQFSRLCLASGQQSCCVPNKSLACFRAVFNAFANASEAK